jgi:geranylgeranyl transferase type-2 subunit alpha
MLSLDSRNFHGWGYRRQVVAALEALPAGVSAEGAEAPVSMTQAEFDYTKRMIGTNLSNFSAWHNRSQITLKLLNERSASDEERRNMLNDGKTSPFELWAY